MRIDHDAGAISDAQLRGDVETMAKVLASRPGLEMAADRPQLYFAVESGHTNAVAFWLERGWDIEGNKECVFQNRGAFNLLYRARDAAMTRYLLSRGASIDVWNPECGTPLHSAVIYASEPSQRGRRRAEGANMEQIRVLIEAGADLSRTNGEGYTPLAYAIKFRKKTAERVLREAGAPLEGRRHPDLGKNVTPLDLRMDFDTAYAFIAERVRRFDPDKNDGPGGRGDVKMVVVGFEHAQAGWVALVFDTRLDARPDGEWTSHIDRNQLKMRQWRKASSANLKQPISLLRPDGPESILPANSDLATPLGDLLKAVLLKARSDGLLAKLPKARDYSLLVEDFNGDYGWHSITPGEETLA